MSYHRSALATLSQATYAYLEDKGHDARELFERAGLNPDEMYDPNARYNAHQAIRIWRIATHVTKTPGVVYEVVKYIEPWMLQAVGHAWMASHTLLAGLQRFERYHRCLLYTSDAADE